MAPKKSRRRRRKPKGQPATSPAVEPEVAERPSRLRQWIARLLAMILAPTIFLGLAELGLRLFGYGYETSYFVAGQQEGELVSNPKFGWQYFGRHLSRSPIPTVITQAKGEGVRRIIVFGGSAAQGVPDSAHSFSRILEVMLSEAYPDTRFEVINVAFTAINSHVVRQMVKDCSDLEGDLYVVYLGNNEVVGPYGAGTVFKGYNPSVRAIRVSMAVRSTRVGQLLTEAMGGLFGGSQPRVWRGMQLFMDNHVPADDPRLEGVYESFRKNLTAICRDGRSAGAEVLLSTVLTNLKDCPPFLSLHRPGMSEDQTKQWEQLYAKGVAAQAAGRTAAAVESYLTAAEIDERYAELHYRLGQCELARGDPAAARERFIRARDLDALRFRCDTRLNEIIRAVAGGRAEEGVHLVDPVGALAGSEFAPDGLFGADLLHEHVHLKFRGNYALAATVFKKVSAVLLGEEAAGVAPPPLQRCAELMAFTPYDEYANAMTMADMMSNAPFPAGWGERKKRELAGLKERLTPPALEQMIRQYTARLDRQPDDLLMRSKYADLLTFAGKHAEAEAQWRQLLRRYSAFTQWRRKIGVSLTSQGRATEAIKHLRGILVDKPDNAHVYKHLVLPLVQTGQVDEAIASLEKAIQLEPGYASSHVELGRLLLNHGRAARAEESFREAIEIDPESPEAHFFLGGALLEQGKGQDARACYRRAIELQPNYASAYAAMGQMFFRQGKLDQAIAAFGQAASAGAKDPRVHCWLGEALEKAGRAGEALEHYQRAIEIDPRWHRPLNALAWVYATAGDPAVRDGARAVTLAQRACQLTAWAEPGYVDTLAAAYAAAGQFDQAVKAAQRAVALATQMGKSAEAQGYRQRLELFEARKVYRVSAP